jgi:TRAP-type C4-dicarboxylate transport system permease small subunit
MKTPRFRDLVVWISGGALLAAVAVDSLAMLGRQVRIPFLGSIEIVQAVVLVAAAGALIIATLDAAHARVNLVLDRLPPRWRARFETLHALAAAFVHASLLAGTVWIAADLWSGYEESELLHIPYAPLRIVTVVSFAVLLLLALRGLFRRGSS